MMIKSLPKKGMIFLTTLFNSILRLNYFPSQWKYAEIIMILKPNKQENVLTSYRPISLLSIFSKIFERILLERLLPVLAHIPDHAALCDRRLHFFSRSHPVLPGARRAQQKTI